MPGEISAEVASDFKRHTALTSGRPASVIGGWRKRAFDVAFGLTALVMLLPLFCLIALAVKAYDRGPMIYRHRRVGVGQSSFPCLKFRTMRVDSDVALATYLRGNPAAQIEWAESRKLKDDPRITPIGAILRKTSLDELPQIFNILVGQMSVVGPRPIVADEMVYYGGDADSYLAARPGLTGLWQVSGRSDTSYTERVRFDRTYVERWSFATDLVIILRTVPAVFLSRGSY